EARVFLILSGSIEKIRMGLAIAEPPMVDPLGAEVVELERCGDLQLPQPQKSLRVLPRTRESGLRLEQRSLDLPELGLCRPLLRQELDHFLSVVEAPMLDRVQSHGCHCISGRFGSLGHFASVVELSLAQLFPDVEEDRIGGDDGPGSLPLDIFLALL